MAGVLLSGRFWPNIKCWLGSFVISMGSRPACKETLYFCDFQRGGGGSGSAHEAEEQSHMSLLLANVFITFDLRLFCLQSLKTGFLMSRPNLSFLILQHF